MFHQIIDRLHPYFLPHRETHQKARLLSWQFLLIYVLMFVFLRSGLEAVNVLQPGVLGTNSNITIQQIIDDTNQQRHAQSLSPLKENAALDAAAQAKAADMFAENYWAHFSPSGKTPWQFITAAGYRFSYAGENLARNFYNSADVVTAWMNSPSHRENILDSHYQDIGIAVMDGTLNGQKTTLVVQMFGRPVVAVAKAAVPTPAQQAKVDLGGQQLAVPISAAPVQPGIAGVETLPTLPTQVKPAIVDPYSVTKVAGISMVAVVAVLLLADYLVLTRRRVFRLSSHHLAHMGMLALTAAGLLSMRAGEIL